MSKDTGLGSQMLGVIPIQASGVGCRQELNEAECAPKEEAWAKKLSLSRRAGKTINHKFPFVAGTARESGPSGGQNKAPSP